ncbi:hypothetical protein PRIPAC_96265 [Pristionchus pacificus]|uniref:Transmembrane ion channel n=1 Tax=Pristionchus pacificus TaxID=54126 RepID=A0A2A6BCN9_PRIPA|nr:hypothetical protein PRIPAC_96265 [Pristionchus pacificus]|eukprot:PDM63660.1 transmembrane ion channel [Pristionchus pacificus]
MLLQWLIFIALLHTTQSQEPTPAPERSHTCAKCVSVIDSYRGQITCRKVMSDQQNIRLLQASFMHKNNNPHLSCIAIKMCSPLDYDIYLKRTHANEEFSYELPPDFHDKLTEYYKNTLVAVSSNSSSVVVLHNISSSHFPLLCKLAVIFMVVAHSSGHDQSLYHQIESVEYATVRFTDKEHIESIGRATLTPNERESEDLDVTPATASGIEIDVPEETNTTSIQVEESTVQIELSTAQIERSTLQVEQTTAQDETSPTPIVENASLAPATQSATTLLTTCLMTLSQCEFLLVHGIVSSLPTGVSPLSRAAQSKWECARKSRDRTISEPAESGTIRADDVVVEQRSRGMSLREVKKNKVDDITDGKEKVAVVKTKVRQQDRERRRTTTIDRSALRPLPPTPSPYMPPISSPPRSPYRTVTPAQHQRVAGYPSRIPSRAREGHARSQSQGGNRASSAFFDSTDSIDQSRPSDGERGRGFALPFNVPSLVRYILGRRNRSRSAADLNNIRSSTKQRGIIKTPTSGLDRNRTLRHTVHFGQMDRPIVPRLRLQLETDSLKLSMESPKDFVDSHLELEEMALLGPLLDLSHSRTKRKPQETTEDRNTEVYKEFAKQNAKLYSRLFKQYVKELSPSYPLGIVNVTDDYLPIPISLNVNHFRVNKVDQVSQSADVVISMRVGWIDMRLVWNENDYGQIPYILVKSDSIWQPNISPCDAQSRENLDDDKAAMAKIYSNGTVYVNLNWAISYSCDMVMSNFPFDSHTCRMCFVLNQLTPDEAMFHISQYYDPTKMTGKVNNEWALISLSADLVQEPYGTAIYFDCNIIRHPTFWVQLVIIPAYFLGVLIITGLFLGDEGNMDTAVNYGLAVMMSITVIIGILADGLPKSSSLPVLGYFVMGQLIIVCSAVLFVVLRREVKKGILFLVSYIHKRKIEQSSEAKVNPTGGDAFTKDPPVGAKSDVDEPSPPRDCEISEEYTPAESPEPAPIPDENPLPLPDPERVLDEAQVIAAQQEIAGRSNFSLDKSTTSLPDSVSSDGNDIARVIDQNTQDGIVDNSGISNHYSIAFWEVVVFEGKTSPVIYNNKEVNMENLVPYSEAWWKATLTAHH